MKKIQASAAILNPFDSFEFLPLTLNQDVITALKGDQFLRANGILRLIETYGYDGAKRLLEQKTCRNTTRLLQQFQLAGQIKGVVPDLYGIYQHMLSKQFTAA
jgi:hypothetical protein